MNFALFMTRTSVRLYERVGFTRCMDFPNIYELCIMHYELTGRPQGFAPTGKFNSSDGLFQQL